MKIKSITQLAAASVFLAMSLSLASAQSSSVKIDILVGKIVALNQADRIDEALPIFEELDRAGFEPTESSSYYRIRALDKAARVDETLSRGHQFLERYGRASRYYGQVIAIVSQRTLDKEQATARQRARDLELAAQQRAREQEEKAAAERRALEEREAADRRAREERAAVERRAREERAAVERRAEEERVAAASRAFEEEWQSRIRTLNSRFTVQGDTVLDKTTNLIWSKSAATPGLWPTVKAWCSRKGDGWDLPTLGELRTLVRPWQEYRRLKEYTPFGQDGFLQSGVVWSNESASLFRSNWFFQRLDDGNAYESYARTGLPAQFPGYCIRRGTVKLNQVSF